MILAALGAVLVFVSVLSYVGEVRAQVGNMRTVLKLTEDVPANTEVTAGMVEPVQAPAKWTPETMFSDVGELQGKVAASNLPQGSYLQKGSVIPAPALEQGQREIAIMINAETGVAYKVKPGSVVDIYATFDGTEQQPVPCAVRVLSSVRVIDVGQTSTQEDTSTAGQSIENSVVPITFALTSEQSLELTYAESFASTLRLARIGGVGTPAPPSIDRVCEIPRTGDDAVQQSNRSSLGGQQDVRRRGRRS